MISIYKPEKQITVYCHECWWSDKWDASSYGIDYDFSKTFFEQFQKITEKTPRCALYNVNCVNSDYCQQVVDDKDCYLCFVAKGCEGCMHSGYALNDRDCFDSSYIVNCELSYECVDCSHAYHCLFSQNCHNCNDIWFSYDLSGCKNCFGCVNLRNKEFHIFNKPYSKEEYFATIKSFELHSHLKLQEIQKRFEEFKLTQPHRNLFNIKTENSSGNNLKNTKNSYFCYDAHELQDCGYCTWVFESKDCYDNYGMGKSELVYETIGDEEVQNCQFNTFVTRSSNIFYSDSCFSSQDLFGCVGVKNKKYMILNKQYSEEEYKVMVTKIRTSMENTGEFGEFFPEYLSPFDYNESIAQNWMPMTKEEALTHNYTWHEKSSTEYQPPSYIIPDSIHDVAATITNELLACESTAKNYKITPQEFAFYKENNLPIPRKCPEQRQHNRISKRSSRMIYSRACSKCKKEIQTTYAPDRPEIVYCEKCYLEAVY